MRPPFSAAALILLATLLTVVSGHLHAQAPAAFDALAVTPTFKPTIKLAESYAEATTGLTVHRTTFKLVANLEGTHQEGINLDSIDPNTSFYLTLGDVSLVRALFEDPNYRQGDTSAWFPMGFDELGREVAGIGLSLKWTAKRLTATLTLDPTVQDTSAYSAFVYKVANQPPEGSTVSDSIFMSLNFAGIDGTRRVYISGSYKRVAAKVNGDEVQLARIHLTGAPDLTPPTLSVAGLRSGSLIDGEYLPATITARDNYSLSYDYENPVQYSISPTREGLESNWQILYPTLDSTEGRWGGFVRYIGAVFDPPPVGPSFVRFKALDNDGNLTLSPVYTVFRAIPAAERGAWEGVLIDNDESEPHVARHAHLRFIVDARGVILSGVLRYQDTDLVTNGLNDGAYRRIPFTGRYGQGQVTTLPRSRGPALKLVIVQTAYEADETRPLCNISLVDVASGRTLNSGTIYRTPYSTRNPLPTALRGRYHLVLESRFTSPAYGYGYTVLNSQASGQVNVTGRMADGSVFTATGHVNSIDQFSAMAPLYGGKGGVLLTAQLYASEVLSGFGGSWHRPASVTSPTWPAGIHTPMGGTGQRYTPLAPGHRIMQLDGTLPLVQAVWLTDADPNSFAEESQNLSINASHQATIAPPNPRQLSITAIDPKTGLITGTVRLPGLDQPAPFRAIVTGEYAQGYYLTPPPDSTTPGRAGHIYFTRQIPTLDSQHHPLYEPAEPFAAAGTSLGELKLGFMPAPGQVVILVGNPGTQPVTGTFTGMPEGALIPISIGGSTIHMMISYVGGDGNDVTLTWQSVEPPPTELRHILHDDTPSVDFATYMGSRTVSTGNLIITALPGDDTRGTDTGSVLIYNATTGTLLQTLYPPAGIIGGSFGQTLAVSGNRLAVGAPTYSKNVTIGTGFAERGLVFLYDLPPGGTTAPKLFTTLHHPAPKDGTQFGKGLAMGGTRLAISSVDATPGTTFVTTERIYVYNLIGNGQPELTHVHAPYGGMSSSTFGTDLAVSSQYLAVSYQLHNKVYAYDLSQGSGPTAPAPAFLPYGDRLALSGSRLLVNNFPHDIGLVSLIIDLSRPFDHSKLVPLPTPFPSNPDGYSVIAATLNGTRAVIAVSPTDASPEGFYPPHRVATYDVSHPYAPRLLTNTSLTLGRFHTPGSEYPYPLSVTLTGNHLAVGYNGPFPSGDQDQYGYGVLLHDLALSGPQRLRKVLTHPVRSINRVFGGGPSRQPLALSAGRLSVAWQRDNTIRSYNLTGPTPATPILSLPGQGRTLLAGSGSYLIAGSPQAQGLYPQTFFDLDAATPVQNSTPTSNLFRPSAYAMSGLNFLVGASTTTAFPGGKVYRYYGTFYTPMEVFSAPGNAAFGRQVACQGKLFAIGDDRTVWIYDLNPPGSSSGSPPLTIAAPAAAANNGAFGYAISISGRRVAIGAPGELINGAACGAVYLYDLDSATPAVPIRRWQAPVPLNGQRFGHSVALEGTRLAIGAPGDAPPTFGVPTGTKLGVAFLYDLAAPLPGAPVCDYHPRYDVIIDHIAFGTHVALSANHLVIAAPEDDRDGWNNGALYIYGPPAPPK